MINRKLNIIYWCDWEAFSFLSCSWSLMNWKLHTFTHMTSWCGIFLFYLEDWGKWVIMCPSLVIFLEGEASSLQLTLINRLYENKGAKSNKGWERNSQMWWMKFDHCHDPVTARALGTRSEGITPHVRRGFLRRDVPAEPCAPGTKCIDSQGPGKIFNK